MTKGKDKYQVEIGGSGQITGSQVAVGRGARVSARKIQIGAASPSPDLDEVRNALKEILEQLRAGPPGVEDAPALSAIAASAQQEADKAKPNKALLSSLLDALMAGVGKVATLASAVEAIQHAVHTLL
jgi:hypothetical protein